MRYLDLLITTRSDEICALQEALGPDIPIYANPRKGYKTVEILSLLMGKVSASDLCTWKPCGVRTFASFIVDL